MHSVTWIGIALCLGHSAMFSGLNLGVFGTSILRLESLAATGNRDAARLLEFRRDSNFLLTTILWGNVAANVLLALLADSVLTGVGAFVFSTFLITFGGEIVPQAYFSRRALTAVRLLWPVLRFYQMVLYPVAKPSALILDKLVGKEGRVYFLEQEMRELIRRHVGARDSNIDLVEGLGALNFLMLDDLYVSEEGERVSPDSVLPLPVNDGVPQFPPLERTPDDPFLQKVHRARRRWVIITSASDDQPVMVLDADGFLRAALYGNHPLNPLAHCHRPILVRDSTTPLGKVMTQLTVHPEHPEDDVIDHDVILVWGSERRVITGADLLGRLLRGIAGRKEQVPAKV